MAAEVITKRTQTSKTNKRERERERERERKRDDKNITLPYLQR